MQLYYLVSSRPPCVVGVATPLLDIIHSAAMGAGARYMDDLLWLRLDYIES